MSAANRAKPTSSELEILKVLWERGPSTAREVLERLKSRKPVGYTTILKMLQLMEPKGIVAVDRSARSHVYSARLKRDSTMRKLVREFVDRTFDGALDEALVHLVDGKKIDAATLSKLEARIQELKKKEQKS
ncbi:MAG: BlaI/MecI/CopY family transcriptional regulator [Planctomycetota bacterium]